MIKWTIDLIFGPYIRLTGQYWNVKPCEKIVLRMDWYSNMINEQMSKFFRSDQSDIIIPD